MEQTTKNRATFQSRLGFILVSAGCAIGLGNVWKFPYVCGQNGGGAFLLLYLFCLVLLGLPILMCEFAIGRGSNRSIAQALNQLEQPGSRYHITKYMGIATDGAYRFPKKECWIIKTAMCRTRQYLFFYL